MTVVEFIKELNKLEKRLRSERTVDGKIIVEVEEVFYLARNNLIKKSKDNAIFNFSALYESDKTKTEYIIKGIDEANYNLLYSCAMAKENLHEKKLRHIKDNHEKLTSNIEQNENGDLFFRNKNDKSIIKVTSEKVIITKSLEELLEMTDEEYEIFDPQDNSKSARSKETSKEDIPSAFTSPSKTSEQVSLVDDVDETILASTNSQLINQSVSDDDVDALYKKSKEILTLSDSKNEETNIINKKNDNESSVDDILEQDDLFLDAIENSDESSSDVTNDLSLDDILENDDLFLDDIEHVDEFLVNVSDVAPITKEQSIRALSCDLPSLAKKFMATQIDFAMFIKELSLFSNKHNIPFGFIDIYENHNISVEFIICFFIIILNQKPRAKYIELIQKRILICIISGILF